jgi:hypothetical protein
VALTAVADAGSISEAARRLGVPKSVVSERLSELARELGGRLPHHPQDVVDRGCSSPKPAGSCRRRRTVATNLPSVAASLRRVIGLHA